MFSDYEIDDEIEKTQELRKKMEKQLDYLTQLTYDTDLYGDSDKASYFSSIPATEEEEETFYADVMRDEALNREREETIRLTSTKKKKKEEEEAGKVAPEKEKEKSQQILSQCSVERPIISNSKNKLLILDVNGLLVDCVSNRYYRQPEPDFWVRKIKVYKRPYCDDFLQFCFDRFHVGIWSSKTERNVDDIIKKLLGESASRLLFCWNQSHCTTTKFSTVENKEKPLVLKELKKLWEKLEPGLPWEKGEFNESNTLLVDDSPYKALVNPMHTAIFPYSYCYPYPKDSSLGDLRDYLERLAMADNVQKFVSENKFGQWPIGPANPSWNYYLKVIESVRENDIPSAPDGGANCLKKKVG